MPEIVSSFFEQPLLSHLRKPEERDLVLAHIRVDVQRDLRTLTRQR